MTYKKLILALFISTVTSFCFAQTDSVSRTDSVHQMDFPSKTAFSLQPFHLKSYTQDNYLFGKINLRLNYADTFFTRPIYYDNWGRRDFSYKFNPTNPWRTSDPLDAIINGSTNYLIQAVDKKLFYKK